MKKLSIISLLLIAGCVGLQNPVPTPNVRGCSFYCFPKQNVTNLLVSLISSNQVTGITQTYTGSVLFLDASNDVVTATFDRSICSNQPQAVVTFAWFCSNKLYSVDKQLPSNSWDIDYGPFADCSNCVNWGVSYLQASVCDQQAPFKEQFVSDGEKRVEVKRRHM